MSRQGVSIGKINTFFLKFFNKRQVDFNDIFQNKQELLSLISKIINAYVFIHSDQPIRSVAIAMQIRR